jgi:hypothetical protein
MHMNRNWLQFAQKLAEGARAKMLDDRQRLERIQAKLATSHPPAEAPAPASFSDCQASRSRRSLKNLPVAAHRADHALLFDNSTEQATNFWFDPLPQ